MLDIGEIIDGTLTMLRELLIDQVKSVLSLEFVNKWADGWLKDMTKAPDGEQVSKRLNHNVNFRFM